MLNPECYNLFQTLLRFYSFTVCHENKGRFIHKNFKHLIYKYYTTNNRD